MKKAQLEKNAQNKEKDKVTFLTQSTSATAKTTKLYDENQMNDESEYDSYFTSYSTRAVEKDQKDDDPNDQLETYEASQVKGGGGQVATCHTRPPVQLGDPPHLPRPDREVDRNAHGKDGDKREVEILVSDKEVEILLLEENKDTAILDTGCARSTSGEDWMRAHIENLSQEDRLDIKRKEGKSYFRFGN